MSLSGHPSEVGYRRSVNSSQTPGIVLMESWYSPHTLHVDSYLVLWLTMWSFCGVQVESKWTFAGLCGVDVESLWSLGGVFKDFVESTWSPQKHVGECKIQL